MKKQVEVFIQHEILAGKTVFEILLNIFLNSLI